MYATNTVQNDLPTTLRISRAARATEASVNYNLAPRFKRAMRSVLAAIVVGGPILLAAVGVSFAGPHGPLLPVPISTVPSNGDLNPYGVLFVAGGTGRALKPGDILVTNFNDSANVMGTGTTIVDIRNGAQLPTPFYTAAAAAEGLDLALAQVGKFIVVGNVPLVGADTAGPGALTVLDGNGDVVNSLSGSFIDGPWGLAVNHMGDHATLYVSNVLDGTVFRLEASVKDHSGLTLTSETQIGGGYMTANTFPAAINGPAGLAYDSKHDILYVASEVDNEIFSIADASKLTTTTTPGTVVYSDPTHLHGPTGLLLLANGDLLTANDDGVNVNPATPSELVEFVPLAPTGTFVTQYSVDPAAGGAFAIGIASMGPQTLLGYVDDNTATLSVLSLFAK